MNYGNVIPSKRVLLLLSGGLDSTALLAILGLQGFNVTALHFSYGQPAEDEERRHSEINAEKYGAKDWVNVRLPSTQFVWDGGYCPARNLAFIGNAAAYAESHKIPNIAMGLCQSVENPKRAISYPDCTRAFVVAAQSFLDIGAGVPLQIMTPFIDLPKSAVVRTANLVGVSLSDTFSCLHPVGTTECGACTACTDKVYALRNVQF